MCTRIPLAAQPDTEPYSLELQFSVVCILGSLVPAAPFLVT